MLRVAVQAIHRASERDVRGLADLVRATTAHDRHRPMGEQALVELKEGPKAFPHAAFAARVGGELAGYAHLSERQTRHGWRLEAFTAPAHRRRGIGGKLLSAVLEHIAGHGGGLIHVWAYNPGIAQERLATRFGMRRVRTLLRMGRELPGQPIPPPEGYGLRGFRPQDAPAWIGLHNRAFAEHPDGGNWRDADLRWHLAEPWFDPEGLVLGEDRGGEPAGYCWMKPDADAAWVYFLGVDRPARGSGLAAALCAAGMSWAAARGAVRCLLYVDDDNEPAVRLYEKLGFTTEHSDFCYELEVPGSPSGARGAVTP